MKKYFLLALLAVICTGTIEAQHCATSTVNITPVGYPAPGLQPTSDILPCSIVGQPTKDTIYFQNFTTVLGFATVDSLIIDSINNLPPGLCWVTNKASNTFYGGDSGIIYVSGTSTAAPGQYQLEIIVSVYTSSFSLTNVNAASQGLRYWIRLACPTVACAPVDTNSPYPAYIAYAACAGPPIATISPAGPLTVCPGIPQTLTASSGTGYTYKWSTGATAQSISVSAAGSYTVTVYHATDSAVSSPVVVSMGTNPVASVSPSGFDTICRGDTVNVTASPTGTGISYHWNTGATTSAIRVARAGRFVVTVTNSSGCSDSAILVMAVKLKPSAAVTQVPASPCAGDTVVLTASQAGVSYQWTNGTTQSISMTASGGYGLTVTAPNGCSASSSGTVTFNTPPAAGITQSGLQLTALTAASYQWYDLQGAINTATAQIYHVVSNNTYWVKETGANGCSALSDSVVITSVGINDIAGNISLQMYPDPTDGLFTLQTQNLTAARYEITDQLGRIVQSQNISADLTMIDVSTCMSGIYYLTVKTMQGERTMRFVVMK